MTLNDKYIISITSPLLTKRTKCSKDVPYPLLKWADDI